MSCLYCPKSWKKIYYVFYVISVVLWYNVEHAEGNHRSDQNM
jgi:hypothetical protein